MGVMLDRIDAYFEKKADREGLREKARALTDLGYSRKEVANELGVPESSVRVWLAG